MRQTEMYFTISPKSIGPIRRINSNSLQRALFAASISRFGKPGQTDGNDPKGNGLESIAKMCSSIGGISVLVFLVFPLIFPGYRGREELTADYDAYSDNDDGERPSGG